MDTASVRGPVSRRESVLTLMAADLEDQLGAMQRIVDNPMVDEVLRVLDARHRLSFYDAPTGSSPIASRSRTDRSRSSSTAPRLWFRQSTRVAARKLRQSRGRAHALDGRGHPTRGAGMNSLNVRVTVRGFEPALARHSSPCAISATGRSTSARGLVETLCTSTRVSRGRNPSPPVRRGAN